jgi:hypothetical protein
MKSKTPRDKKYLRRVAELPCVSCGLEGSSQAAHANFGKGMSIKASDYDTFPLCCDRPGVIGCHTKHDRMALIDSEVKREVERDWIFRTRSVLGI